MNKNENCKTFRYEVNQEYWKDLQETYWEKVIIKKEKEKPKKIKKPKENNFVMLKQMTDIIRKNAVDKLWFTYFWYLQVLLDTLDYNNKINFNILLWFWVSEAMVKVVRKKLKDLWYVKRFKNDFYLNPEIAIKWTNTPLYVINLFKTDNQINDVKNWR